MSNSPPYWIAPFTQISIDCRDAAANHYPHVALSYGADVVSTGRGRV